MDPVEVIPHNSLCIPFIHDIYFYQVEIDNLGVTESPSSQTPRLPIELERGIFEITAILYPISATRLVLVAWRVHEW